MHVGIDYEKIFFFLIKRQSDSSLGGEGKKWYARNASPLSRGLGKKNEEGRDEKGSKPMETSEEFGLIKSARARARARERLAMIVRKRTCRVEWGELAAKLK